MLRCVVSRALGLCRRHRRGAVFAGGVGAGVVGLLFVGGCAEMMAALEAYGASGYDQGYGQAYGGYGYGYGGGSPADGWLSGGEWSGSMSSGTVAPSGNVYESVYSVDGEVLTLP